MEPTVLGTENELTLVAHEPALSERVPEVARLLVNHVGQTRESLPFQEANGAAQAGFMLVSGRVYLDAGGFVEYATPEVRTPEDVLTCQGACERILLDALPAAARKAGVEGGKLALRRAAVDYAGHHCGMHANILARRVETTGLVEYLLPFLVTRPTGAGGWGSAGFTMTQKASAIRTDSSLDTRNSPALVDQRQEPLAVNGFRRIHLCSADQTMSEFSTYLTIATTALVVHMLDRGACVGPAMALHDPIAALRQLDTDYRWNKPLPLRCGAAVSAVAIQEHYLKAAERFVQHPCEPWMGHAVARWRETLEQLKADPLSLANKLDNFAKMKAYAGLLRQQGLTMADFAAWAGALALVAPHLDAGEDGPVALPRRGTREFIRERVPHVTFLLLEERMNRHRLAWAHVARARKLWREMLALDLSYHDLGDRGLYARLRSSGAMNSRITTEPAIRRAMESPPGETRARLRAQFIRELRAASEPGTANWMAVTSAKRTVNLADPFAASAQWRILEQKTTKGAGR